MIGDVQLWRALASPFNTARPADIRNALRAAALEVERLRAANAELEADWAIRHSVECGRTVTPYPDEQKARTRLRLSVVCGRLGCHVAHRYVSPWEPVADTTEDNDA